MSDPLTFMKDDTTAEECDVCGTENNVTVRQDIRTRVWEMEEYTCRECGAFHRGIDGQDRGATNALTSLITLGVLLIVGALAAMFFTPATVIHQVVILTGAGLVAGACGVAAFAWLKQNGLS